MPVVERDARLLAAGAPALAAALGDRLGEPTLVVLTGPGLEAPPDVRAVQELPVVLAARAPVEPGVAAALDLVLEGDRPEGLLAGFDRAPAAATAAALLLRTPPATAWDGLVRESTTYSMLQGSEEFRRWRAEHGAPRPAGDPGPRVRVARHGRVTEVTLTRPQRHNALDVAMRDELYAAFDEAPGPVVLLGEGPSFCSGGDLDEFGTFPDPALAHLVRLSRSLAGQVAARTGRVVVGLRGACLGAGIELAAFAERVVASDDARVGLPELGLGLVPGAGGTVSLPRRIGRHRTLA
ncbi:MAG TPA: enoyl-CoA hydratase/isomerase family protein, partial [Acidimicrobiia bacterium]|nr:enoyl-CoA hydratase/isomerase family protein [Acidimicrobiia bacterium]